MAKKFDTNPLDPKFPESVKDTQPELETVTLPKSGGKTTKFAEPLETEEQTRKLGATEFEGVNPNYGNGNAEIAPYQPQQFYEEAPAETKTHNIGSISLPENVLTALPYIPFAYIGIIAGVIELVFIPKSEPKVRYHAAQGLAAQIAVWIVLTGLGFLSWGTDVADVAATIFSIVTSIMLMIFAYKALRGKPIHIESVQDLTDWIEEKITPKS
ncbi:MAG: hypothetical protein HKN25_14760 [Pyrinomonadaceae bacterium]|nr:hypothetical protein [Pyrinomonadaceae bacterium]